MAPCGSPWTAVRKRCPANRIPEENSRRELPNFLSQPLANNTLVARCLFGRHSIDWQTQSTGSAGHCALVGSNQKAQTAPNKQMKIAYLMTKFRWAGDAEGCSKTQCSCYTMCLSNGGKGDSIGGSIVDHIEILLMILLAMLCTFYTAASIRRQNHSSAIIQWTLKLCIPSRWSDGGAPPTDDRTWWFTSLSGISLLPAVQSYTMNGGHYRASVVLPLEGTIGRYHCQIPFGVRLYSLQFAL